MTVLVTCEHAGLLLTERSADQFVRGWLSYFWLDHTDRNDTWNTIVLQVDKEGWRRWEDQDGWVVGHPLDPRSGEAA